jgi:hypothetical protein
LAVLAQLEWHQGNTENISHSGALVRVESPPQIATEVEVRLVLPGVGTGEHPEVVFAIERYDFLTPYTSGRSPSDASASR